MTQEIAIQSAVDAMQSLQHTREPLQGRARALVGDGNGNLVGNNGAPWVLCRLGGDVNQLVQAYNGTFLVPSEGMSVTLLIKYKEGRVDHYEIERLSSDVPYPGYIPGATGGTQAHHLSHEGTTGGGWDLVNVYPLNLTMLRCDPQATPDLTLAIGPGMYWIGSTPCYYAGGTSPAFTPPVSGSEYHVLSIDAAGTLTITVNAITYPPFVMTIPSDNLPIAAPYLYAGQTVIVQADLAFDPRPFLTVPGSAASSTLLLDSDGIPILDSDGNLIYSN